MSHGGLICPDCGGIRGMATQSTLDVEGNRVRNRVCRDCGHRFATVEVALEGLSYHKVRPSTRRSPQYVRVTTTGASLRLSLVESAPADVCRRGHPFTPENTYIQPSSGNRSCMECRRDGARRRYHHARRNAPPSIIEDQRAYWRELYYRKRERAA